MHTHNSSNRRIHDEESAPISSAVGAGGGAGRAGAGLAVAAAPFARAIAAMDGKKSTSTVPVVPDVK